MSVTRRSFLKATAGGAALVSFAPTVPGVLARAAAAPQRDDHDTVLVVVQLSGGNDGLNTVVPYDDDQYARARTTLRLPADQVHKIDLRVGLHPRMNAMMRLYKEGYLSIVQGVGYPNQDRSHPRGMRIWHTADPRRPERQTGWLGRVADHACQAHGADVPAVFMGPIARPFAVNAEKTVVPSIRSTDELVVQRMPGDVDRWATEARRTTDDNPLLGFVGQSAREAYAGSRRLAAVLEASNDATDYPPSKLAKDFRSVAQLIRAELGIRIFLTEIGGGGIGGFDNHANQLGNHCALLEQLSEAVAAFIDDLHRDKLADRVVLMTFSEFGRTLAENGRHGTGHGAAAPVLLAGGRLKGGLTGEHPDLSDLDNGAPKFHTDFRRLYATMLDRWLGFDSTAVLGDQFEPVDVLDA
jgi:uncharacterized protein (DUF1501 family)